MTTQTRITLFKIDRFKINPFKKSRLFGTSFFKNNFFKSKLFKMLLVAAAVLILGLLAMMELSWAAPVDEVEPNDGLFSQAQNIDGTFSTDYDPDIGDTQRNTSTTIPHATVIGTGDGTFDYYSFTVPEAGYEGIFDIDEPNFGFFNTWDSYLRLYDSDGNFLAYNDDSPPYYGQGGSISGLESYLEYEFSTPGTYYIQVGQCCSPVPVPSGVSYKLQVSVGTPVNTAPVANDDTATTYEGLPTDIYVLSNDTDADGDALSIDSFTQPTNGTVTDYGYGRFNYTPNTGYIGPDSFTYTVSDGHGGTATATVNVTVNADPAPQVYTAYPQQSYEGQEQNFYLGYFYDPGSGSPWHVSVDWGDGSPAETFDSYYGYYSSMYRPHTYASSDSDTSTPENDPYNVTVTVTEGDANPSSGSANFQVTVNADPAPQVTAPANQNAFAGTSKDFDLGSFEDSGSGSPWQVSVDWGDGSEPTTFEAPSAGSLGQRAHTYASSDSDTSTPENDPYNVTVTVTEGDANPSSDSANFQVTVVPAPTPPGSIVNDPGCRGNVLLRNDDGSTGAVTLPFTANFFGNSYGSTYVNNNGNVTFDGPLGTYTPFDLLSTRTPIIAPFFADVDTRNPASDMVSYGAAKFGGRDAFCVNWTGVSGGVGYYNQRADKLNTFQLLLVDRSDVNPGDFDIIMNYDRIRWETGDASGGTNGLGGSSARIGFSNGSTKSFELPGSAVNGAFLDTNPETGLIYNSRNSLQLGRYVYEVRNGDAPVGGAISGGVYRNSVDPANALHAALVQVCGNNGSCNTSSTNSAGKYSVSGLANGEYKVRAFPPASSTLSPGTIDVNLNGQTLEGQDVVLTGPTPIPADTTITSRGEVGGVPTVYWNEPLTLTTQSCQGGTASYRILGESGEQIRSGSMTESSAGNYTTTIQPLYPNHGKARVEITISNCSGGSNETTTFDIYIDPSGVVKNTHGDPIDGATVTLYRSDSSAGPFQEVPNGSAIMSPSNRENPDTTDSEGRFGWDVFAGYYKVKAEKEGCTSTSNSETGVLQIPEPVSNLELVLDCPDDTPPVLDLPADITAEATGPSGAEVPFTATAHDEVDGDVSVTCNPASGSTFALGETTVNCSAKDAAENEATGSFKVTVVDTTKPSLTLPGNKTVEATGPDGALVTYDDPTATDIVDSDVSVTCDPPSGDTFPLGTTLVTCTATDDKGNTATGTFNVTVEDTTKPTITLTAPEDGATYDLNEDVKADYSCADGGSGVDKCEGPVVSGANLDTASVGQKTFEVKATDKAGNTASVTHNYEVVSRDTTPPQLQLPSDITQEATKPEGADVTFTAKATDEDPANPEVTCTPAPGSTFPIGTTKVKCSAKDTAGNEGTGSFNVTVQDTKGPDLQLPADITEEATSKDGVAVGFEASATDAVDGSITPSCTPASGSTFPLGTNAVTCSAKDSHNNEAKGTFKVIVSDTTKPKVECDSADGAWHKDNVGIRCTASDIFLANPGDASFQLYTNVSNGTENVNASTESREVCDTSGNCQTAGPISGNKVDRKAPEVSITSPKDGDKYNLKQDVKADYSCADGGSGVDKCEGPVASGANLDTASVGQKTFEVKATDKAGNTASVSRSYSVVYDFRGFFQPVDNQPTLNKAKAGSAIPVKFSLSGDMGLDIFAKDADGSSYPKSQKINCDSQATVDNIEQTVNAGSSSLSYDASSGQYNYVWKTDKAWAGTCRKLTVKLKDGTVHEALFKFTN